MKLELTLQDVIFLQRHLTAHIANMDLELVHTDKRELQRELVSDLERLRAIQRELSRYIDAERAAA